MKENLISPWILKKIQYGEAILFLGAGAVIGAESSTGKKAPTSDKLRDKLCDLFLDGTRKDWPLHKVADYAMIMSSLEEVQLFIKDEIKDLEPADFHLLIPLFKWHAIVTTNYDLVVEKAYDNTPDGLQTLESIICDGDNFSKKISDPLTVPYLKLHGCITRINDPELPLILSTEQYVKYDKNRKRLFSNLRDWGYDHPIIFCGYDVNDPHIQHILFDLSDSGISRPRYAIVNPTLDEFDTKVWNSRRIDTVPTSFKEFLVFVNENIEPGKRQLSILIQRDSEPITSWFSTKDKPSKELNRYLNDELEYVHKDIPMEEARPYDFYRGLTKSWDVFVKNLDIRREITDDIIIHCLEDETSRKSVRCILLKGFAGSGKSITLRRAAWEAANEYKKLVLYLKEGAVLRPKLVLELYDLVKVRFSIFLDDVLEHAEEVLELIQAAKKNSLPINLIFGARYNEWNVYGEDLAHLINDELELRNLTKSGVHQLIDKLEANKCLGHLKELDIDQRIAAFTFGAERQLLVALHEATSGKSFEELVFDEYQNIVPQTARILYLDICTLHRLRSPVRPGLISRISGVNLEDFRSQLFQPLEHVVRVIYDVRSRDYVYKSRHPLIARFVFEQSLQSPSEKAGQIVRMISSLNIEYKSDEEAFTTLIKGRDLAELFSQRMYPDKIYEVAYSTGADSSFIKHQQANFELNHRGGNVSKAYQLITEAESEVEGSAIAINHTKAMILRRMANDSKKPLEKQKFRVSAKKILKGQLTKAKSAYPYSGLAQILLDEVKDVSNSIQYGKKNDLREREFSEIISELEHIFSTGIERFPQVDILHSLNSDLSIMLGDTPKAIEALEKAFDNNPMSDRLALRLAEHYVRQGDIDEAKRVLYQCLEHNPDSKRAHLVCAKLLMGSDEEKSKDDILHHLKRSFTHGDTNIDAQLLYGRQLYLHSPSMNEAKEVFSQLGSLRLAPKVRNRTSYPVEKKAGELREFRGVVKSLSDNYCFVHVLELRDDVFIHYSQFAGDDWEEIKVGLKVTFNLAFSIRGPLGVNAVPEK